MAEIYGYAMRAKLRTRLSVITCAVLRVSCVEQLPCSMIARVYDILSVNQCTVCCANFNANVGAGLLLVMGNA